MSNKSFCDKCGEEIPVLKTDDWGATTPNTVISVKRDKDCRKKQKNYDICDKCLAAFETWMTEKPAAGIKFYKIVDGRLVEDIRDNIIHIGDPLPDSGTWLEAYPGLNGIGNNSITCIGSPATACMSGRMSCKDPNLSNIQQLPKFTTP